jgi:hypothetical protein
MALTYGPKIVTDGLVLNLDAGSTRSRLGRNLIPNPTTLSSYAANQSVTVSQSGKYIQAVSNQTTSTPGVWPIGGSIPVSASTRYTFRVKAGVTFGSNPQLYALENGVTQLAFTGTISSTFGWTEISFTTTAGATVLQVGILWSAPALNSTVLIEESGLHQTAAWYDTSINNLTTTFSATRPSYFSTNGGYYHFTGSETATLTNPLSAQTTLGQAWTVNAWINVTDDTNNQSLLNLNSGLFPSYGTNNSLLYLNSGANDYYTYGGDVGGQGWGYLSFRFRNVDNYRTIYRNNVNISTGGPNATFTPSGNPGTLTLGSNLRAFLAKLEIYNRVLTDAELAVNYNAYRGRFGL